MSKNPPAQSGNEEPSKTTGPEDHRTDDLSFDMQTGFSKTVMESKRALERPGKGSAGVSPQLPVLQNYRVNRLLGEGGMGQVYEVVELDLNRRVALKTLKKSLILHPQHIMRFKNEAKAVAQLSHPHIVPVYHVGSENGEHYYTMQLIEGQNLATFIKDVREKLSEHISANRRDTHNKAGSNTIPQSGGKPSGSNSKGSESGSSARLCAEEYLTAMSARRSHSGGSSLYRVIAELGAEIAGALDHAHEHGIVHRDIKPSNILIDHNSKPWVTDFGLAMVLDGPNATQTGDIIGTIRYMSPEQASGRRFLVDHRTDIYSLGVTLYEMLTLHRAFEGETYQELLRKLTFEEPKRLRAWNPAIPEELEIIVSKAMDKNPQERYQSAKDMAADLQRFASDQPILAKKASIWKATKRWISRHQSLAVAAGIVIIFTTLTSLAASGAIWNALVAEKEQREVAEDLLRESEGMRLVANASLYASSNPGLSLALANAASEYTSGLELNNAILNTMAFNHELKSMQGRDPYEHMIELSENGKMLLTLSPVVDGGKQVSLNVIDVESGLVKRELSDRTSITKFAMQPGGSHVLTFAPRENGKTKDGSNSELVGSVLLWDLSQDKEPKSLGLFAGDSIDSYVFSNDGKRSVLVLPEGSVTVIDTETGTRRITFRGHASRVERATISPDGKIVASIDSNRDLKIWSSETGDVLKNISVDAVLGVVKQLGMSHDGKRVIIGFSKGISVFDIDSAAIAFSWMDPEFELSPQFGIALTYSSYSDIVTLRNTTTGEVIKQISLPGDAQLVRLSHSGKHLIIAEGKTAYLIDVETGKRICQLNGHDDNIFAVDFSESASKIVTSSGDRTIKVWSPESLLEKTALKVSTLDELPTATNSSREGRKFVFGVGKSSKAFLLSESGQLNEIAIGKINVLQFNSLHAVVFSDQAVRVVDCQTSRLLASIAFDDGRIVDAVANPSGEKVLFLTNDGHAFLWDWKISSLEEVSRGYEPVTAWAVSRSENLFALGYRNGDVEVVDFVTKKVIRSDRTVGVVWSVAFLKGSRLLVLDSSNAVTEYRLLPGEETRNWKVPTEGLNTIRTSTDGGFVFAFHDWKGSQVVCWDNASGEVIGLYSGEDTKLKVIAHPKEPIAILVAENGEGQIWNASEDKKTSLVGKFIGGVFSNGKANMLMESLCSVKKLNSRENENIADKAELVVFDENSGDELSRVPLSFCPKSIVWDDVNSAIGIVATTYSVASFDLDSPSIELTNSFGSEVLFVKHFGNTGEVVVVCRDGSINVLDNNGAFSRKLGGLNVGFTCGAVSPDGALLGIGDSVGRVRVWDLLAGKEIRVVAELDSPIHTVKFDLSGNRLVAIATDGSIGVTDLRSDSTKSLSVPGSVMSVKVSDDVTRILLRCSTPNAIQASKAEQVKVELEQSALAADAESIFIVDTIEGKITTLPKEDEGNAIELSLDGQTAFVGTTRGAINIVGVTEPTKKSTLTIGTSPVLALALHPDGKQLAALMEEQTSLWNVDTNQMILRFKNQGRNTPIEVLPYRGNWSPFTAGPETIQFFGDMGLAIPSDPVAFLSANLPRPLSSSERESFRTEHAKAVLFGPDR